MRLMKGLRPRLREPLNSYLVNIGLRVYLADVSFMALYNEDIYESFIYFIYKTRNL